MIYGSQYSTILEIAGLFQDYVIRIYSGWVDVNGYKANIQDLDLPGALIKYIMGLGTIDSVKVMDNHVYVYMTGNNGNNFTVQIEHI